MSLEIARQVNAEFPQYLQTNTAASCHWYTVKLIEHLRAKGYRAFHVCKTKGEGQYIPEGFQPRIVAGLDGKPYTITGVSHDAIWCDDGRGGELKIYDTAASANDAEQPIYKRDTPPFWSFDPADGPQIVASPVWNEVPSHYWRPNNPPLREPAAPPKEPGPVYPPYPSNEADVDAAGVALFADFAKADREPDPQMFRFAFRVCFSWLTKEVPDLAASVAKHRKEWKALLGLPPQ